MNRLMWDLRWDDPVQIPGAFYEGQAPRGPIVAPGRYQVRLKLGDKTRTARSDRHRRSARRLTAKPAIAAKTALALADLP